uniref:Uncharacterized protein n=1 Tax=Globodera rostochiensis TaxID=31243 RepID=A0A914GU37_GLORO
MPASPSSTQKSLKFGQIRAKFDCSSICIQNGYNTKIGNEKNTNTTTTTTVSTSNVVASRRKMFEHLMDDEKANSTYVPLREAPPPPSSPVTTAKSLPPITHQKPKLSTDTALSPSSTDLAALNEDAGEGTNGVKNMVEKLNRIGHRPFGPFSSMANTLKTGQLSMREVEIAEEVDTDSSNGSEIGEIGFDGREEVTEQRRGSTSFCQEANVRTNILEEMRSKEIFKKSYIASGIPSEIGKYRPLSSNKKSSRKGCASDPPPDTNSQIVSDAPQFDSVGSSHQLVACRQKTISLLNSQNKSTMGAEEGGLFEEHFASIPQYSEMDEKESKRLRELHKVALEIYRTQRSYVLKLQLIGLSYPRHLCECEKRQNKRWFTNPKHVIIRIADHFQTILRVHLTFLHAFYIKMVKWNSREPDMAEVFQKNADFLKICKLFLAEKQKLVTELQQALNENQELADATIKFEQGLPNENPSARDSFSSGSSNCGSVKDLNGISIVLQLDAVHQNVLRYKLLMERYRNYLPYNSAEAKNADEALKKLASVTNDLNDSLTVEDEERKLLGLHEKLKGLFNVLAPGRKLLHTGELKRQTRKELQLRQLILFSDTLLICRYATLAPLDSLDAKYIIPIEEVQLELPENDETACEFIVLTPYKSSTFIAKSKWERDHWMKRIGDAVEEAIQRRATRAEKQKSAGRKMDETTLSEGISNSSSNSHFYFPQPEMADTLACNGNVLLNEGETCEMKDEATEFESALFNVQLFQSNTALWIPDNKSSKCMNGCGTSFAFLRRRHHCRQCGCIICSNCEGMAPVGNAQGMFKRSKVCPKCFFNIRSAFEHGLFPPKMVRSVHLPLGSDTLVVVDGAEMHSQAVPARGDKKFSLDDPSLRVSCDNGTRLIHPAKLFNAPANGPMKKSKHLGDGKIVSGKVFLRTHQKGTVTRWATLTTESALQFYKAQFDDQPAEHFFIFGYSVRHSESEDDSTLIELTHRNQILTERKEDQIVFHVQHSESAKKWLEALRKVVQVEQALEESSRGLDD